MAVCLYCIDNDIIKKLATFQRFDRTIAIFGASTENLFILETAKYKFENDWKKLQKGRICMVLQKRGWLTIRKF